MQLIEQQLQHAQAAWLAQMDGFKDTFGCVQMPSVPMLTEQYLQNCRVVPHREFILRKMPHAGVAAEVGVQTGFFSRAILDICQPSRLHLLDIDLGSFSIAEQFTSEIERGVVDLHEGDSSTMLSQFPDQYFNFIYVDGDHSYDGVKRDIQAAITKVKPDGYLIFNDYTYWSPVECMRYGVMQAVNELCVEDGWEMVYFALAQYMYCDVALRRLTFAR